MRKKIKSMEQLIQTVQNLSYTTGGGGNASIDAAAITSGVLSTSVIPTLPQSQITNLATDLAAKQTSSYTTETQDYITRMKAASGEVDGVTLDAIDRFWMTIDSFKSKAIGCGGFFGKNLASALVTMKAPSGLGTLTNTNFVAADWSAENGFTLASNSTKALGTGIVPSTYGITTTNISIGAFTGDDVYSLWHILSDNPASGVPQITMNGTALFISNGSVEKKGRGWSLLNGGPSTIYGYKNAVIQTDYPSTALAAATFNSEITLFKGTYTGSAVYGFGRLGFYWIGTLLTKAESKTLGKAVIQLMIDTGRFPAQNGIWGFTGDSNTNGNGITDGKQSFPIITAKKLGVMHYVTGAPSSQLRQTAGGVAGGNVRYLDMLDAPFGTLVVGYGTNDMNIGDNGSTATANATITADFKTKYQTFLQAFLDIPKRIIVLGIPYVTGTIAATAKLDAWNLAASEVAATLGLIYVDACNNIRDLATPANALQGDGLHLSATGHALVAEHLVAAERGIIYRILSLDFPSIAAAGTGSLTVTMFGARAGMTVNVTPQAALAAGLGTPYGVVTANDVVTVYQPNMSAGAIDAAAAFYRVTVNTTY